MDIKPEREFEDVRISVPWGYVVGRWYGNRKLRPILAIHGWLDNIGTWDTLVPLLPQHVGVLCIDLPGHGQSSHYPKGIIYHVIDFVHIIVLVMKEFNWQKVSLMGHSMGSLICFIYTTLYPHKVDLFVAIDTIKPFRRSADYCLKLLALHTERTLIDNERLETLANQAPPAYTYEELEHRMYEGSHRSVALKNCKYLLNRSLSRSATYPGKFYFSRDGRVKNLIVFRPSNALSLEMVKRIHNVPYLVIKASESFYISEDSDELIKILRQQNPHFELHEVAGTHHVHLNNPQDVAAVLNPYINRHRPAKLDVCFAAKTQPNCKL